MNVLLRQGFWGVAATVALLMAVFAATSEFGSQRLAKAVATTGAGPPPPDPVQIARRAQAEIARVAEAQRARLAATEAETRKLSEAVQSLHSERDRLLARIASLERNLEDVTGSIKRQLSPSAEASAIPSAIGSTSTPATVPAAAAPQADRGASNPASQPTGSVNASAPGNIDRGKLERTSQPIVGIDIGGATSFDGLRVLWKSVRTAHPTLFEDLHPIVVVRENVRKRNVELRLVVGPLPDSDAATQLCAALTAARRPCRPAPFEGQQLVLAVPTPARRPASKPSRKPASSRPRPNP